MQLLMLSLIDVPIEIVGNYYQLRLDLKKIHNENYCS